MTTAVVTDSTSGFAPGQIPDLTVVPLHLHFGDDVFEEGVDMSPDQFWARLNQTVAQGAALPQTSQPSPGAFRDAFAALAEQGADAIVSIHISGELSGTLNSARQGAALLHADRPDAPPIACLDSRGTSLGLGWGVEAALDAARGGASPDDVETAAFDAIARTRLLLFVETIDYLLAGGRIGRARHLAGKLLRVRPLLELVDGVVTDVERPRTRRKALDRLVAQIMAGGSPQRVAVLHGDVQSDADALAARLAQADSAIDVSTMLCSPVLGAHVGPGTVGAAVMRTG